VLTERCKLADRVVLQVGNALDLPYSDETFDVEGGSRRHCFLCCGLAIGQLGSSRITPQGLAVDDHGAAIVLRDAGHAQGRLTARPFDIWTLG